MTNKRSVAIITARGGSKRIPRKNIKEFCGKPIIAYSIEAALESGIFDEVMVSTDDVEIAKISKEYGAKVPFMRSEETSNDYATTSEVLMEVLQRYKENGIMFEYMCCIYPTAPFITAKRLIEAAEVLCKEDVAEVIPIVKFSFPPQRGLVIGENGKVIYKHPEYKKMRSQDIEDIYHDAGQFYFYDVEKYFEMDGVTDDNMFPIVLDDLEVQDIDNETDWKIAEVKYRILKELE